MSIYGKDLHDLKNLGAATVNILSAIGVTTSADLQRLGAVETYRRVQARGIKVSRAMLYALEGALRDVPWKQLDPAIKERLVQEAESSEAGN